MAKKRKAKKTVKKKAKVKKPTKKRTLDVGKAAAMLVGRVDQLRKELKTLKRAYAKQRKKRS